MSSYIPTSDQNVGNSAPMLYLRGEAIHPESYSSESPILAGNVMMYMNNNCIDMPNAAVHDSSVVSHHQEFLWRDGRNLHSQTQGLSLSLGTHIIPPSGIQFSSSDYRNHNVGFSSFMSQDSVVENNSKVSFHAESMKTDNYGMGNVARAVTDSKYLKSAQQLLDEIVNVGKALKQHNAGKQQIDDSKGTDDESKVISQHETDQLSASEKQDLQNKMTKLISMLEEVDRRYKQYYHQMQIVVSAFDVIAGCGAAKPYTALALQTISRHFRCLRDAISDQIKETHRSLGETDSTAYGKGVGISRLRFVDQQLKQQRALQQLGMMQQHTWRPQRGLPETSVSILRAWLFEHFLHPYPKDLDKIMLARQTGLTRSQVSNWFINARVRLWKPMVEEMYKEEAADAEIESNSSSDIPPKGNTKTSVDQGEDINQSTAASTFDSDQPREVEMANDSDFQNMMVQSNRGEHNQLMAAAYQMPPKRGGVSLTLGLQHCEDGSLPPMASLGNHHQSFGGVYEGVGGSSVGSEAVDFDCSDSGNQQQRFGPSHLLHDFVA